MLWSGTISWSIIFYRVQCSKFLHFQLGDETWICWCPVIYQNFPHTVQKNVFEGFPALRQTYRATIDSTIHATIGSPYESK